MHRCRRRVPLLAAAILTALLLLPSPIALAVSVGTVTVSPTVVPVPASATRQTAVLVSATVSGLAAGASASCAAMLTLQATGATVATSTAVTTSPAPASGTTSVTFQLLVPGLTAPGAAQATVNCGGATTSAPFRISSIVGVAVTPASVPAGGVATFTVMIAAGAALAATPCTLIITVPSGATPPLLSQTVSVSGGTLTVPATTSASLTLPAGAALGRANVSVSCVLSVAGTVGDSADFTITDPTVVTILGVTTPAVSGSPLTVTSVTLPGFSCVALFTPPAGVRVTSSPALADATGTAVNTIPLAAGLPPGAGSLSVICTDPANPSNSATSATQSVPLLTALILPPLPVVSAAAVGSVAVSPTVVPVPTSATLPTAVLVSTTVSGLAVGASASCTATLTLQATRATIVTSGAVTTSPAPASGTASVAFQLLVPGLTTPGAAQATVNCGGPTTTAAFRISSIVGVAVLPASVPAGGVASFTAMIAAGATLAATPCTLVITDPSGATPPLLSQTVSVSGGTPTVPAATSASLTLPAAAALGRANVSVSCVFAGAGTVGDSADFTITDPTIVTILGVTTPAVSGSPLTVTSVTLPGFSCVALFTPPAGVRVTSSPALADATGTAVNTIPLAAGLAPGAGSLSVICSDPANPSNSATSATQSVPVVSTAALTVSAALLNTLQPVTAGVLVSLSIVTSPGAACTVSHLIAGSGSIAITESSASGSVPASGLLMLGFHLPASTPSGSADAVVSCSYAGLQASAQAVFLTGAAPASSNCAGTAAPAGSTQAVPTANAGSAYLGSVGEPLQFSGNGSLPSAGAVVTTCIWTFGDGGRATTLNPTHTYAAPGLYTVTLVVSDSAGLSATATAGATISGYVPLCSQPALTGAPALGVCIAPLVCPATSLAGECLPPCQTLSSGAALCPQPSTSVQIGTGGPYQGQVSQGVAFQASVTISGTRRLCSPDATLGTGGPVCNLVPADDLPSPVSYGWDFGDGSQAAGAGASHTYAQSGTYDVTLTVGFDDGSTATGITVALITGGPGTPQPNSGP